jgi:hypothetical protein
LTEEQIEDFQKKIEGLKKGELEIVELEDGNYEVIEKDFFAEVEEAAPEPLEIKPETEVVKEEPTKKEPVKKVIPEEKPPIVKTFADELRKNKIELEKPKESKDFKKGKAEEKKRINAIKDEISQFIKDNRQDLNKTTGRGVSAMLKRVNNAKTPLSLKNALDYMTKLIENNKFREQEAERFKTIEKIDKITSDKTLLEKGGKKPKAKRSFLRRTQERTGLDRLQDINKQLNRDDISSANNDMGKIFQEGLERVLKAQEGKLSAKEEALIDEKGLREIDYERLEDIEYASVWEMPNEQIKQKLKDVERIRDNEKTIAETERAARKEQIDKDKSLAITEATPKGKKVPRGSRAVKPQTRQHIFDFVGDSSFASLLSKTARFSEKKGKGIFNDALNNRFLKEVVRPAEEGEIRDLNTFQNERQKKFEEIFKAKGGKLRNKLLDAKIKVETKVPFINESGKIEFERMSQAEALQKWLESKSEKGWADLFTPIKEGGMGWIEGKSNIELENFLSPEMKKVGEWLNKQYNNKIYDYVNPAYKVENGVNLTREPDFVPFSSEPTRFVDNLQNKMGFDNSVPRLSSQHHITRKPGVRPLLFTDALDVYENYLRDQIHYKNWAKPVRELANTFSDPEVRKTIQHFHGTNYTKTLDWFINEFAGNNARDKYTILDDAVTRLSKGTLFLSRSVGVKQAISSMMYLNDMSPARFAEGLAKMMVPSKQSKEVKSLLKSQAFLLNRGTAALDVDISSRGDLRKYRERNTAIGKLARKFKIGSDRLLNKLPLQTVEQALGANIKFMDRFPILNAGGGYFLNQLRKSGKTWESVKREAKKLAEKEFITEDEALAKVTEKELNDWAIMSELTQQSQYISNISRIRGSNSLSRAFNMFTSGPSQIHRIAVSGLRDMERGVKSKNKELIANGLRTFTISHILMGTAYTLVGNGLKWDDDKQMWGAILGNTKGLAYFGKLITFIDDLTHGKPWARKASVSPIVDNLRNIGTLLFEANKIYQEGKLPQIKNNKIPRDINNEKLKNKSLKLSSELAKFAGIPVGQGIKLYEDIDKVYKDESDNPLQQILGLESDWDTGVPLVDIFSKEAREKESNK